MVWGGGELEPKVVKGLVMPIRGGRHPGEKLGAPHNNGSQNRAVGIQNLVEANSADIGLLKNKSLFCFVFSLQQQ